MRSSDQLPASIPRKDTLPSSAATALVYCEDNLGRVDGKTANGLVRYSEMYEVVGVIDSTRCGLDAGAILDGSPNGIPVFKSLDAAVAFLGLVPTNFIYGMAPATGKLSAQERQVIRNAIRYGMNIINGLHEFLNDDAEFVIEATAANVLILDVRRPRATSDLRLFTGRVNDLPCPRIAVLGTDCAIGKRTTASILTPGLECLWHNGRHGQHGADWTDPGWPVRCGA